MKPLPITTPLHEAFVANERFLWSLAYRMTGSAADADDIVQETFVRAVEHPPANVDEPLRPWLLRVTMNLARDALRHRKSRAYIGPWLPSPVEDDRVEDSDAAPEARYELRESASYAFLIALEALSPPQRAVLLLRDVFDYSIRETATTLRLSEINTKVIHHRARRSMQDYDRTKRSVSHGALADETLKLLERMMMALMMQDVAAAQACLTDDAILLSDGGGEFRAALNPLVGPDHIGRFFVGLLKKLGENFNAEVRTVNRLPALLVTYPTQHSGWAPRLVLRCDVTSEGKITGIQMILATPKLTAIS
jgi:RNA polymerase sigma-70 factor (ECF subfamily)